VNANPEGIDEALASLLQPGQDIVVAQGFGFPRAIMSALSRHAGRLQGSRVLVGLVPPDMPVIPSVHYESFFPSGPFGSSAGIEKAGATYLRCSLYELSRSFRDGERKVDLAIAMGTPARDGYHSLGLAVDFIGPATEAASAVLLEVAQNVPWTGAGSVINHKRIVTVESPTGATTTPPSSPITGDTRLAENLLPLIPDGAVVELGMGRWFEHLIGLLIKAGRSIHLATGSLGDWVADLAHAQLISLSDGLRATAAGGSQSFYEAFPALGIELVPAYVTHDPVVLRSYPAFRAINSVLEVDLLGRANCEYGQGGRRGGLGGLPDFARAAAAAEDGLSIIALPAAAGGISRIVPKLAAAHVSLERNAIDVIVSEYGVADLRGRSDRECAKAILQIAQPDKRHEIEAHAHSLEIAL